MSLYPSVQPKTEWEMLRGVYATQQQRTVRQKRCPSHKRNNHMSAILVKIFISYKQSSIWDCWLKYSANRGNKNARVAIGTVGSEVQSEHKVLKLVRKFPFTSTVHFKKKITVMNKPRFWETMKLHKHVPTKRNMKPQ